MREASRFSATSVRACAAILGAALAASIGGCGQKGALYLPEPAGEVVTRPMQTPDPEAPAPPDRTESDEPRPRQESDR